MIIYNTLTNSKQKFEPITSGHVNFFVCGPTVYDFPHLGHAKTYTQFDLIVRYLRTRGFNVFYLQNITDIDDKIIERAKVKKTSWQELSQYFEKIYLEDMVSLHNTSVTKYARATDYISHMINQIKTLLEKGYAYTTTDGIYFEISKFPMYGALSGRLKLSKEDAVSRIDSGSEKRGWNDFCLWKYYKHDEPFWSSDLGDGRPGWHIEDTAITEAHFGPQYDIHGGAVDLIIPHHEAEIAQMEATSDKNPLVRYWLHTGFLNTSTEKMSKSKANFVTIRDALREYSYRTLRFFFLSSHYKSSLNYDSETLVHVKQRLQKIDEFVFRVDPLFDDSNSSSYVNKYIEEITNALDDDFNTPRAIASLFEFIKIQNTIGKPGKRVHSLLDKFNNIFDILELDQKYEDSEIDKLISQRNIYRSAKNFQKADAIRRQLHEQGIQLYDSEEGTTWRKV